eukprot:1951113-Amphidinium_carterae.1
MAWTRITMASSRKETSRRLQFAWLHELLNNVIEQSASHFPEAKPVLTNVDVDFTSSSIDGDRSLYHVEEPSYGDDDDGGDDDGGDDDDDNYYDDDVEASRLT